MEQEGGHMDGIGARGVEEGSWKRRKLEDSKGG